MTLTTYQENQRIHAEINAAREAVAEAEAAEEAAREASLRMTEEVAIGRQPKGQHVALTRRLGKAIDRTEMARARMRALQRDARDQREASGRANAAREQRERAQARATATELRERISARLAAMHAELAQLDQWADGVGKGAGTLAPDVRRLSDYGPAWSSLMGGLESLIRIFRT